MLAKHGKLLAEALQAVQARPPAAVFSGSQVSTRCIGLWQNDALCLTCRSRLQCLLVWPGIYAVGRNEVARQGRVPIAASEQFGALNVPVLNLQGLGRSPQMFLDLTP